MTLAPLDLSKIPTVWARHFTETGSAGRKIDVLVVHTMEAPEKPTTAENVAAWFAGSSAPQASAHYCLDSNTVVRCVDDMDVAWHAPGANHNGIGIEHAGYAAQTPAQWADAYSKAELALSERLAAALCRRYGVPPVPLTARDLANSKRGITTHMAVSAAFRLSDHHDPGPGFPLEEFCKAVASLMNGPGVVALPKLKEPEPTLHAGATGWRVRQVQRLLVNGARINVTVDGIYGPLTIKAVQTFQKRFGIKVDGIVGPQTWHELWKARYS